MSSSSHVALIIFVAFALLSCASTPKKRAVIPYSTYHDTYEAVDRDIEARLKFFGPGWIKYTNTRKREIWLFTEPGSEAHPTVILLVPFLDANKLSYEISMLCEAPDEICYRLPGLVKLETQEFLDRSTNAFNRALEELNSILKK
jgi:hypothetical protein